MSGKTYAFRVNGRERITAENKPLLRYLRDDLHIHSAKDGCSEGACGACTVLVDGVATKACVLTTELASGRDIVTVEGGCPSASGRRSSTPSARWAPCSADSASPAW